MTHSRKPSLSHIADIAGVSAKTVSNALHGGSARMSNITRARIHEIAANLGYVPNEAARAMRQGFLPIVGVIADGLITSPFATDITRALDNTLRRHSMTMLATSVGAGRSAEAATAELVRFMPRAVAYAAMYHKVVDLSVRVRAAIRLLINCQDLQGQLPALVPAEADAADCLTAHLIARGRRRIALLNLPGVLAGTLRENGFRRAHAWHGLPVTEAWLRAATRGPLYSDRAPSLVPLQIDGLFQARPAPDAIVCGNDRVAMEVMNALRRRGITVPGDVAVAGFDNQVEIAARLDPPLTTMALPHRMMGRIAAEILLGERPVPDGVLEIPFRLIERGST